MQRCRLSFVTRTRYYSANPKGKLWSCEVSRYNTALFFACQRRTAIADAWLKKEVQTCKMIFKLVCIDLYYDIFEQSEKKLCVSHIIHIASSCDRCIYSPVRSFVHSFVRPLVHSFVRSFIHSLINSSIRISEKERTDAAWRHNHSLSLI